MNSSSAVHQIRKAFDKATLRKISRGKLGPSATVATIVNKELFSCSCRGAAEVFHSMLVNYLVCRQQGLGTGPVQEYRPPARGGGSLQQ